MSYSYEVQDDEGTTSYVHLWTNEEMKTHPRNAARSHHSGMQGDRKGKYPQTNSINHETTYFDYGRLDDYLLPQEEELDELTMFDNIPITTDREFASSGLD